MNLVQIQDRLRSMPMPLLMQYANGSNPEVPPYVALAVLKEKQTEQQQMSNMQGAAQGQMPSVKSQLEQKVGTMQQQASMQPMGLAQGPAAPAPQGPVQMASGGLASSARFAGGGAIKYEGEGKNLLPDTTGYEGMSIEDMIRAMGGSVRDYFANEEKRHFQGTPKERAVPGGGAGRGTINPPMASELQPEQVNVMPSAPQTAQGLGTARPPAPQGRPPQGPAAAPGRAAPAPDSMEAMLRASLAKSPEAPSVEGAAGIVQGMQKQFGVDKPAGEEERRLIEQMNQRYAEGQKGKDLRDFQSVMSAFGRGPGAAGLEGVRLHEASTAADLAHQKGVYDMLNKINTGNRAEQVGAAAKGMGIYGDQEKAVAEKDKANLQALVSAYHTNVSAGAQLQSARIMAAAREAGMDTKEIQAAEAAYARDPEATAIKKLLENPMIANNPAKLQEKIKRLDEIQRSKYEAFGAKMPGATPSAPKTGGKVLDWNSIGK